MIGASGLSDSDALKFSGACVLQRTGLADVTVGTFKLEAKRPAWTSKNMEFNSPGINGVPTTYVATAAFDRPTNGKDAISLHLGWRPFEGGFPSLTYSSSKGEPGNNLYFRYEPKSGVRITCSGNVE